MTQPPDGYQPAPAQYPQQQLLPQDVQSSRSRKPLIISLIVVLALIVGAVVAWAVLRNNGDSTRAAYCNQLKQVTNNGNLMGLATSGNAPTLAQVKKLQQLAPSAVKPQWDDLFALVGRGTTGSTDPSMVLRVLNDFQVIANDASANCGIKINLPGGL
ncbi:MAG: hypothetical protein ACR2KG_10630 [Nocardioidaceae bacterium]